MRPLADIIRADTLENFVGQQHIIGEGKPLRKIIESKNNIIPNLIFYGPPGVGKTTLANIIAKKCGKNFYKINATNASVSDIKDLLKNNTEDFILAIDEIQNFNKKQQQSLLEYIEDGRITLIAMTSENPYFYIYNAILSRSIVFEFKNIEAKDIINVINRGILEEEKTLGKEIELNDESKNLIATLSGGDIRKALNILEISIISHFDSEGKVIITPEMIQECSEKRAIKYDKNSDNHYDLLSAFQKSIRGSDPNASIYYLSQILLSGDLQSACRRLMVIASEDIGLAYPIAATIVNSCVDSAYKLGLPEARIPLAQATLLLATSPKSNSAITAIDMAIHEIETNDCGDIPDHLKDAHYSGAKKLSHGQDYLYPHNFENHYVKQQYLPNNIKNKKFYSFGENKVEQTAKQYWDLIKK